MVYLDNAATTYPKPEAVYLAMDEANRQYAVNAGRGSYRKAKEASEKITMLKSELRKLIHADNEAPVVLGPSITVALNQIINGLDLHAGETVYVSPYEHNAVARTLYHASKERGFSIEEIPIDEKTLEINIDVMRYQFSKHKPSAVFCTHVSNVTGYILPIAEIFEEAKKYDCKTILDTAQSLGLVELDVRNTKADIVAFAGHKALYGPFGIGGFINVSRIKLNSFLVGGTGSDSLNLEMPSGMESMYEPASANIVAIAGLLASLNNLDVSNTFARESELSLYLVEKLRTISGITVYGWNDTSKSIGVVSFSVDGMDSNDVAYILDADYGIAVRSGYHCAPFVHRYLHDESSKGTIRAGIGRYTTRDELDQLCKAICEIGE